MVDKIVSQDYFLVHVNRVRLLVSTDIPKTSYIHLRRLARLVRFVEDVHALTGVDNLSLTCWEDLGPKGGFIGIPNTIQRLIVIVEDLLLVTRPAIIHQVLGKPGGDNNIIQKFSKQIKDIKTL